jgi:hypothetical protein
MMNKSSSTGTELESERGWGGGWRVAGGGGSGTPVGGSLLVCCSFGGLYLKVPGYFRKPSLYPGTLDRETISQKN